MLMVSYFTVLLRVEVRRELELAYARGRLIVFGIREVSTPVGLPWWNIYRFEGRLPPSKIAAIDNTKEWKETSPRAPLPMVQRKAWASQVHRLDL
jgi:hypothetical protein